jgi:hypothetical protein
MEKLLVAIPFADRRVQTDCVVKIHARTWALMATTYWVCARNGYCHEVDNHFNSLHRAVWEAENGQPVPKGMCVDHSSRDLNDLTRLRLVTAQQNSFNRSKQSTGTTSKYNNVYRQDGRWWAACEARVDGERKRKRGSFESELEAACAADRMKRGLHGEHGAYNADIWPEVREAMSDASE